MRARLLFLVAVVAWARPVSGHPAPFSYLDVHLGTATVRCSLVLHVIDVAHELGLETPESLYDPQILAGHRETLVALVRTRLRLTAGSELLAIEWQRLEPVPDRQGVRLEGAAAIERLAPQLNLRAQLFPYDPVHQTFVNIYEEGVLAHQAILDGREPQVDHFAGTAQGRLAVIRRFVAAGIHHIVIGPDHILFLIGLLLLGGSLRHLAVIVSAFTLAHSVTLTLAALDLVHPPVRLVEPAIALSIVYVGADNLLLAHQPGRDVRAWVALLFGLVHGFGFASVLREMRLPAGALGWSLLSFNVGVEIGQFLIVVVVAAALAAVRQRHAGTGQAIVVAGSVGVMVAGAYWFIERVFFT